MLRDVVAQGPLKSSRNKNVDGYGFSRATSVNMETARKTGAFPEQANCNGVGHAKKNRRQRVPVPSH